MKNDMLKNILIWIVVATVMLSIFNHFSGQKLMGGTSQVAYSEFINQVVVASSVKSRLKAAPFGVLIMMVKHSLPIIRAMRV